MFLRTLCLADSSVKEDRKQKKLRNLLCESAANLAELFARLVQPVFILKCIDQGMHYQGFKLQFIDKLNPVSSAK